MIDAQRPRRVVVFGPLAQHLARALQSRQCFRDLRADHDNLENRRDQQPQKNGVGHKGAERHVPGNNLARSQKHDERADHAEQRGGRKAHQGSRGEGLEHILEKPPHACGKHRGLASFSMVTLHHAYAAQRFREPPCDFGVDFGPGAKDGTDHFERIAEKEPEAEQNRTSQGRHENADAQQNDRGKCCRQHPAHELDQSGSHQVSHPFHIAHDARDEDACLVGVVVGHGQPPDMRLHLASQFSDQPLRGLREELGQSVRRYALHRGGGDDGTAPEGAAVASGACR